MNRVGFAMIALVALAAVAWPAGAAVRRLDVLERTPFGAGVAFGPRRVVRGGP